MGLPAGAHLEVWPAQLPEDGACHLHPSSKGSHGGHQDEQDAGVEIMSECWGRSWPPSYCRGGQSQEAEGLCTTTFWPFCFVLSSFVEVQWIHKELHVRSGCGWMHLDICRPWWSHYHIPCFRHLYWFPECPCVPSGFYFIFPVLRTLNIRSTLTAILYLYNSIWSALGSML